MTLGRMLELLLFVIVNNVPYLVGLMIYPFRDKLRFSRRTTYVLLAIIILSIFGKECVVEIFYIPAHISTIFGAVTGAIMMFGLLKARLGKTLMMMILVMNLSVIPLYLGKYTEGIFFYENSLQSLRWSHTMFMALWEIPLFYVVMKYMKTVMVPAMTKSHGEKIWSYLWMVPATFFVIWNIYLAQFPYYAEASMSTRTISIAIIMVISFGSMIIYHVTFLLINERIKNENYAAQYRRLHSNIDEARKARHDVRHHLVMIDTYLQDGKIEELRRYLEKYRQDLPMEEALSFCDHYGINAVLTYTKQQANMLGSSCNIKVDYPADIPVSEQDLTIIIGNLLENALEACRRDQEEEPEFKTSIDIKGRYDGEFFLLAVTNTSLHPMRKKNEHTYISSKRGGSETGIGLSSVESIVKKNHGKLTIEQPEGFFKVGVIINAPKG